MSASPPTPFPPSHSGEELSAAGRLLPECGLVLAAARSSLHPRRWIVALLLLLLLGELGRLHDLASEPRFGPAGLLAADPAADLSEAMARAGKLLATEGEARVDASPAETRRRLDEAVRERATAWRSAEPGSPQREAILAEIRELEAVRPLGTAEAAASELKRSLSGMCEAVVAFEPAAAARALRSVLFAVPAGVWRSDRPFLLWWGVPAAVLCCFFGGIIARIAACSLARRQWLSISDSTDFAVASAGRLSLMALIPILAALVLLLLATLWSLAMRVPWLDLPLAAAFGVPLGLTLLAAMVLLGGAAASPLLVPAVVCEDADAGDCLQRAFAFAIHRPARYLALLAAALVGGVGGVLLVDGVAVGTLQLAAAAEGAAPTWWSAALGDPGWLDFGRERTLDGAWLAAPWAAEAVAVWATLLRMVVGAYAVAVFFDAGVRVYLLQRFACDGRRPEEIADSPGRPPRADRVREAIAAASRGAA